MTGGNEVACAIDRNAGGAPGQPIALDVRPVEVAVGGREPGHREVAAVLVAVRIARRESVAVTVQRDRARVPFVTQRQEAA